jgi:hypothetical protein
MPFYGEAQQQMKEWEATRKARANGEGPLLDSRFGVRTIGVVAEIQPGVSVWTDLDKRRTTRDEPIGGIVLEVIDGIENVDGDTGEIRLIRAFRCFDPLAPFAKAFRTVREDEIGPDGIEGNPSGALAKTVRRFCREVAGGRGLIVGREARLVTDAAHLAAIIMGGMSL